MSAGFGSKVADVVQRGAALACAAGIGWATFKLGQGAYRGTLLANFRKQAEEGKADMYSLPRLGEQGDKVSVVVGGCPCTLPAAGGVACVQFGGQRAEWRCQVCRGALPCRLGKRNETCSCSSTCALRSSRPFTEESSKMFDCGW